MKLLASVEGVTLEREGCTILRCGQPYAVVARGKEGITVYALLHGLYKHKRRGLGFLICPVFFGWLRAQTEGFLIVAQDRPRAIRYTVKPSVTSFPEISTDEGRAIYVSLNRCTVKTNAQYIKPTKDRKKLRSGK